MGGQRPEVANNSITKPLLVRESLPDRTRLRSEVRHASQGLWAVVLGTAALYFVFPFYWLVIAMTKTNSSLFGSFGLWFSDPFALFDNVRTVLSYQDGIYAVWTANSFLYSGVTAALASLVASLAGYALAKYRFRGREAVFGAVLVSLMIPSTALVLPLFLILRQLGWINSYWAIIVPSVANPFGTFLMRMYIRDSIPDDLLDAARVDGASELRIFSGIVLRLIGPGIATLFLLTFVGTWNNFFLPLVALNDPKYFPLTVGLATWNAASTFGRELLYNVVITGTVLSVVPLVVLFFFLQRYWQSGLTIGSLRG
ncbi:carbohydrate ABC transporter permease [Carboxydochorda subterranea]|uniref:Carbohydrate ABC transporter permease n=1 Tax=Carboxydichorda subterranea TaxID=3109565 RepID=A0ABZ1BZV6_9FIRM|nr:carbohydrate ABC transporter permease [Limnochorda sp. L945t]WRP18153.1 carbohydrate ABC transporter permease [Limnochorda sp. L945t]